MAAITMFSRCSPLLRTKLPITSTRYTTPLSQFHSSCKRQEEFSIQDKDDFDERVMKAGKKLTIVDFHASWCGPCKILAPRFTKALEKVGDKVDLAKVDIDHLGDLAMEYKVSSVPTVLFFKDGKIVHQFVGAVEQDLIEDYIEKYM